MNNRIKELAEQAGYEARWSTKSDREEDFDLEEFAALIVQECCEIAHCNSHVSGISLGNVFKEHFESEE